MLSLETVFDACYYCCEARHAGVCRCQLEEANKVEHAELEELCKERTDLNNKIETLTAGNCFSILLQNADVM